MSKAKLKASIALRENRCMVCGDALIDYDPRWCCGGEDCGCCGFPIDPPVCSYWCESVVFKATDESTWRNLEANQF